MFKVYIIRNKIDNNVNLRNLGNSILFYAKYLANTMVALADSFKDSRMVILVKGVKEIPFVVSRLTEEEKVLILKLGFSIELVASESYYANVCKHEASRGLMQM